MSSRITIKEIARRSNVSIGTVDRVLHNRGRVADSTKDKILKIAKEGNYASNVYARNLRLNKTYKVVIILPLKNSYWNEVSLGIKNGVAEIASMGFMSQQIVLEDQDEDSMIQAIDEALSEIPDGVIFAPSISEFNNLLINKLEKSQVPYVFVDANLEDASNLAFVGQDSFQSGVVAGKLLDKEYASDFSIYIITFNHKDLSNATVIKRMEGLESFYKDKSQIQIRNINLERDHVTLSEVKAMMLASDQAVHVFVPNSYSYKLAGELSGIKKTVQLRLVGYDLIEQNKECLTRDTIDYIIDQKPKVQGNLAVQALYKRIVLNSEVTKVQYLPIEIITKENLAYF